LVEAGSRNARKQTTSSTRSIDPDALEDEEMPYVIMDACLGTKDQSCVEVCPVDCIYEGDRMLVIHPDECIDCSACVPECPVEAIALEEDVPDDQKQFIAINALITESVDAVNAAVGELMTSKDGLKTDSV